MAGDTQNVEPCKGSIQKNCQVTSSISLYSPLARNALPGKVHDATCSMSDLSKLPNWSMQRLKHRILMVSHCTLHFSDKATTDWNMLEQGGHSQPQHFLKQLQILIECFFLGEWFPLASFIQCCCSATAGLSLADEMILDNAIFHPWMRECHTPKCQQAGPIACCSEVMAVLLLVEETMMNNVASLLSLLLKGCNTFRFQLVRGIQCFSEAMARLFFVALGLLQRTFNLWIWDRRSSRCLQVGLISCCFEVMAMLLHSLEMIADNETFHLWMKECHTPKSLQVAITPFFSVVMAMLLHAAWTMMDNAPFHLWLKQCHTPKWLLTGTTLCFSEVTAVLLHVGTMNMDNVTSHLCMKDCRIFKFLQVGFIPCFSEVMVVPWRVVAISLTPPDAISLTRLIFPYPNPELVTFAIGSH